MIAEEEEQIRRLQELEQQYHTLRERREQLERSVTGMQPTPVTSSSAGQATRYGLALDCYTTDTLKNSATNENGMELPSPPTSAASTSSVVRRKPTGGIRAPHLLPLDGSRVEPKRMSQNDPTFCRIKVGDEAPLHKNQNPHVGWYIPSASVAAANRVCQFKVCILSFNIVNIAEKCGI